jgi:hypothetical protein
MTFTTKAQYHDELHIVIPRDFGPALGKMLERAERLHGGYITITLGTPKRPRSTGSRSQNSKVWGMCSDIADQFQANGIELSREKVYEAMKRMAVEEGYPTRFNPIDGIEEPESQSRVSVEQDKILINVIQRFADENSLYLTEIDENGQVCRCIGGKKLA